MLTSESLLQMLDISPQTR